MIISIFFLSLLGIIYSFETKGDLSLFFEHLIFVLIGIFVAFFLSKYKYENFKKISLYILLIGIFLLIVVLFPGIGIKINGARRWINLGFITFQPTEYIKLALIIFLAHWFDNEEKNRNLAFFLLSGLIFALIMFQPDMGTAMLVMTIGFSMFIVSKTTNLLKIFIALPILFIIILSFIFSSSYRFSRLDAFLNHKSGESYHIKQALISVGSGQMFGVGIGKSRQKYSYLPENNSDSIFGIIAEETGFVGSSLLLLGYVAVFIFGYKTIERASDSFGKFIAFGITMFLTQGAFLNLSSMISLVPLTGIPLPFISSGGTALIVQFASVGILLNINNSRKHGSKKSNF